MVRGGRVRSNTPVASQDRQAELRVAKQFGANVRAARYAADMTQEALSEASGLHPTFISNVERGYRVPTIVSALKLAEGLSIDVGDLFKGVRSPSSSV